MQVINKIIWGYRKRFGILWYYLNKARQRTSWSEMMFHMFSPSMYKVAAENASLVRSDDKYSYYRINGYDELFLYPRSAPYYSLAMVLAESRPQHWHYYEIPETAVAPGDIIVDCGSAEGFFSFRHQHTASHIYAMEPLSVFIDSLGRLFQNKQKVTILPYAAGDSCKEAFIGTSSADTIIDASIQETNSNGHAEKINIVTIDSLFADKGIRINYLKADIEGFEENMIRGALETIRISKPKIAITTYHKGQDYRKLIEMIKGVVPEYNYRIKGIDYLSGNPIMLHMWI
ncbi:FkbM family methyltransferase [Chitinophaga sp.]|uniref:FkbM family methyltransferase n=1 Tax=Chitinophaga sp. TaxID=1869181 RepID=UPI0031CF86F5